ncbi:MAG: hypothetical protein GWP91_25710 [Rhodobacterales bacterium]|nr:hypothetical protein [Rhodobacterales bacterium]
MVTRCKIGLLTAVLFAAGPANAHGLWGHVHVTGWAAENMPDDELRAFLLEPEVFNALLFGAVFTDSGYAVPGDASRAFSEHAHWEPFIADYVEWMRVNDPPPWTTLESKKRVAFLMGCGSHGLQDSIFDSLFLYQIIENDGVGQDEADPASDGFLSLDGHLRFFPERDIPMDVLLELYADVDPNITEDVILDAVELVTTFYINGDIGPTVAASFGESYEAEIPWTRVHYMDPEVPGSLRAEIFPTMRYQQALWKRLHGELDPNDVTVFAFPEAQRRLLSADHTSTSSWASLIFGAGVAYQPSMVTWTGPDDVAVPFTQGNTRWGADHTRLIRLMPNEPLLPGGEYTIGMPAGVTLIDGQRTTQDFTLDFQVACDADTADLCPDLGPPPVASIDGVVEESDPVQDEATSGCGCATGGANFGVFGWALLLLHLCRLQPRSLHRAVGAVMRASAEQQDR